MKTLTYYVATVQDEHHAFSLRAQTREELVTALKQAQAVEDETTGEWTGPFNVHYAPIAKVSIPYTDTFHLMTLCTELSEIETGFLYTDKTI